MNDITSKIQLLGNPFVKSTFAKNVWDMQVYNGKIYLSHGDFNTNAGPISVIYYDPAADKFITHFTADEEQINLKVLNDKLYILGNDAREDWQFGNFYVIQKDGSWIKYRTIPKANHVFDMSYFNSQLYVACGTAKSGWGEVLTSKDSGLTWESATPSDMKYGGAWCTTLFELSGKLHATGRMYFVTKSVAGSLARYMKIVVIDENGPAIKPYPYNFTPDADANYIYNIERPTMINNSLAFLARNNLFVATALDKSQKIILPEQIKVYDLLVRDNFLYALGYVGNTNIVYKSTDLQTWTEVLRFNSDTFARSFEEFNGDFYFGLGCEVNNPIPSTGNILKITKENY